MASGMKTVIYPVKDLAAAKAMFAKLLGVEPYMDAPYYVGFSAGGYDVGLDPNGHAKGMTGPVCFWHVDDIQKCVAQLVEDGATENEAAHDVGAGNLVASVKDPDGNVIGLFQAA